MKLLFGGYSESYMIDIKDVNKVKYVKRTNENNYERIDKDIDFKVVSDSKITGIKEKEDA